MLVNHRLSVEVVIKKIHKLSTPQNYAVTVTFKMVLILYKEVKNSASVVSYQWDHNKTSAVSYVNFQGNYYWDILKSMQIQSYILRLKLYANLCLTKEQFK